MLHNEKKAVHNIGVYSAKRCSERDSKNNRVIQIFWKRNSDYWIREDSKMMRINGFNGTNTQAGMMGTAQANDSVSKNIQNQISNAQQKLQDLSSNEDLSLEDKMKKRQEIQQEIANLNQQLRQHQIEQRKEQQSKSSSTMDDMVAGTKHTSAKKGTGFSQAGMQALISADSSMKQAKAQGSVATQMKGQAGVLESEIRQDAGKGNTEKKEAELADLQEKAQSATGAQMSALAEVNKSVEEAAAEESKAKETGSRTGSKMGETDSQAGSKAKETDIQTKEGGKVKETDVQKVTGNVDTKIMNAPENTSVNAGTGNAITIETPASEGNQLVAQQVGYTPIDVRL